MSALGEYLAAAGRKVRQAGTHDCATFPAGWAILKGHTDPMAAWRGHYDTEEQALSLAEEAGGLVELFGRGLAGLPVVDEPGAGDIGVVRVLGHDAGAIFAGERWALVAERGLLFAPPSAVSLVRAWRP